MWLRRHAGRHQEEGAARRRAGRWAGGPGLGRRCRRGRVPRLAWWSRLHGCSALAP
jgi:hypothetical protein